MKIANEPAAAARLCGRPPIWVFNLKSGHCNVPFDLGIGDEGTLQYDVTIIEGDESADGGPG